MSLDGSTSENLEWQLRFKHELAVSDVHLKGGDVSFATILVLTTTYT